MGIFRSSGSLWGLGFSAFCDAVVPRHPSFRRLWKGSMAGRGREGRMGVASSVWRGRDGLGYKLRVTWDRWAAGLADWRIQEARRFLVWDLSDGGSSDAVQRTHQSWELVAPSSIDRRRNKDIA
ncbi:hypothetical protein M0R45_002745 [Rubus argutus]|uniref:Uncharacterized protein n=1 Tax=Rubus argutus TaxID=59490 RepID=A0AAW1VP26_RUBAR